MGSHPEKTVALVHRMLASAFVLAGLAFVLAPNGTVRTINAVGSVFRVFPPAPETELRFWVVLSFSYMILVTLLAWRISSDPRGNVQLMPILAAGKLASSSVSLVMFALHQPAFIYLLNFLVDGSIVLIVLGCYAWLVGLERIDRAASEPTGRAGEILRTMLDAMVPHGGAFESGAADTRLDEMVWQYFQQLHPLGIAGLQTIAYVFELSPYLFGPRRTRFSRLSLAEREASLSGWEHSKLGLRRQLFNSLKLVVMLHFYDSPQVCAAIGYETTYLRDKLLAGPNAAFHRARLN